MSEMNLNPAVQSEQAGATASSSQTGLKPPVGSNTTQPLPGIYGQSPLGIGSQFHNVFST